MGSENPDRKLTVSAISALHSGNKTEAIKCICKEKGAGLKDAREIVEEYLKIHPEIQAQINKHQTESIRGYLLWLIIVFIAGLALYYF